MVADTSGHLYVHVPFCTGKCAYCAFYSVIHTPTLARRFLAALDREIAAFCQTRTLPRVSSVYFGGGTPSVLSIADIETIARTVRRRFNMSANAEWTIEANPGTLSLKTVFRLRRAGINRVSLGAQSFDDSILASMKRRHSSADTADTIAILRRGGITNIAMDLIAAYPGCGRPEWRRTLDKAISTGIPHISVYALTVEPGSQLAASLHDRRTRATSDRSILDAIHRAEDILCRNGYSRYEISNYAFPGRECRHNLSFWRGGDYAGFGPAASSRLALERWTNKPDLHAYLRHLSRPASPPREFETLSVETNLTERFIFRFRLAEGVDLAPWRRRNPLLAEQWKTALESLKKDGLVECAAGRWRLTARGRDMADTVAVRLIP